MFSVHPLSKYQIIQIRRERLAAKPKICESGGPNFEKPWVGNLKCAPNYDDIEFANQAFQELCKGRTMREFLNPLCETCLCSVIFLAADKTGVVNIFWDI
jgi:hypothetical protein